MSLVLGAEAWKTVSKGYKSSKQNVSRERESSKDTATVA